MAIWQDTENCWPHSYFSSTSQVVLRIIIYIVTFSLLRVNIVPLHIKRKNLAIAFSQHYASIIVCTTFTHDINITMECYNFHLHSHMYFKEIGENKYTYQHYFPLLVLFTPPQIQVSIWHHFPSACGTPLSVSCSASMLATKSHFHLCHVILSFQVLTLQFLPAMVILQCLQRAIAVLYFVQKI